MRRQLLRAPRPKPQQRKAKIMPGSRTGIIRISREKPLHHRLITDDPIGSQIRLCASRFSSSVQARKLSSSQREAQTKPRRSPASASRPAGRSRSPPASANSRSAMEPTGGHASHSREIGAKRTRRPFALSIEDAAECRREPVKQVSCGILLNRSFEVDSSCAITSSSAVCWVSASDSLRGDRRNIGLHQVGLRSRQLCLHIASPRRKRL